MAKTSKPNTETPSLAMVTPPAPPITKPVGQGEETQQQTVFGIPGLQGVASVIGGMFPGFGYMGFGAGYGSPNGQYNAWGAIGLGSNGWPLGTWSNYELMDRNPTVSCAQAVADAPGKATEIAYESKPWADPEWAEFIQEQMSPWERYLLNYGHRALDDGFAAFEVVYGAGSWNRRGSIKPATVLKKLKFLFPWSTQPRVDIHGNLTGIDNQGVRIEDPRRCLWIPYDDRGVWLYGRSRKNNFCKPWLDEEFLYDFLQYAMGVIVRPFGAVSYPYDPSGSTQASTNNSQALKNAQAVGSAMAAGQWVNLPNPFAAVMEQMIKNGLNPKDLNPYQIQWYEPKHDSGEAFERLFGVTGRGIVMGHLRAPRTMLEAKHGSKADASEHGDDGDLIGQQAVDLIMRHANQTVVDTLLVQNFGPEAKGAVWMSPSKAGKNLELTNNIVLSLFKGTIPPATLLRLIALKPEFEKAGVKTLDFDQAALVEEMQERDADDRAIRVRGDADDKEAKAKASMEEKKASRSAEEIRAGELPDGWTKAQTKLEEYFTQLRRGLDGSNGYESEEDRKRRDNELAMILLLLLMPWASEEAESAAKAADGTPAIAAIAVKRLGMMMPKDAKDAAEEINQTTRDEITAGGDDVKVAIANALSDDRIKTRSKIIAQDQAYKAKIKAQLAVVATLPDAVGWFWRAYPDACFDLCLPRQGKFYSMESSDQWFVDRSETPGNIHCGCRCRVEVLMSDGTTYLL